MKAVTIGTPVPEVFITKNKSRLKIYNNEKVYLNDGDNFELELFNNQPEEIGFEILLNGKLLSDSLLILKPAQRYFLDRFIDDSKKFLFETYKVENTQEIKDIISNNGKLTVRCYKEQQITRYQPYYYPYSWGTVTLGQPYYEGTTHTYGTSYTTANNTFTTSTLSFNCYSSELNFTKCCFDSAPEIETGRIEKGGESDQKFGTTTFNSQTCHFFEKSYQMLPVSTLGKRPDNIKIICKCGFRIRKQSDKFCSKCGRKID